MFDREVVVIGGGPAGVEVARLTGAVGLPTTVCTATPVGGRATFNSLVPSKAWLAAAQGRAEAAHAAALGLRGDAPELDLAALRARIERLSRDTSDRLAAQLAAAKVELVQGMARLIDEHTVELEGEQGARRFTARHIVVCSGSGPRFFPDIKPDGKRIIAPRLAGMLEALPESLIMVGAGATGCEYASAFAALGSRVTMVTDIDSILPRTDPVVAERLHAHLTRLGLQILTSAPVAAVRRDGEEAVVKLRNGDELRAAMAFLAIGRIPDLAFLGEGGLELARNPDGGLRVDAACRTSVPSILAAGDVTGVPMIANRAVLQARIAARSVSGEDPGDLGRTPVIEAVYTHPAVAQLGDCSGDGRVEVLERGFGSLLKARLIGADDGLLRLWVDRGTGVIRGASACAEHAADLLLPIQTAMRREIPIARLAEVPAAHPTLSEVLTQGW
jgi:dihydrolipoamide dehydrogenase